MLKNTTICLLVISVLTPTASWAQDAITGDADQVQDVVEEIVVRGTRRQLRDAIIEKRELDQISDVLTEDDMGNLPDFNAAEALARIPGVTVANDQAEGRFVTIRGLNSNFNQTTVDGVEVSSTDVDGRRIEMDVIPASLAGSVQVIKSLTPDMDASAIGGTINFVSRSPFDYEDNFFAVTGAIGAFENGSGYNGGSPSGNADFVWSDKFGPGEQFGLVVSGNYYRRDSYLGRIEQGDEILFADASLGETISARSNRTEPYGSDLYIPEEWKALDYHNLRQRYGGSFKFEYRPSDRMRTWLRGYFNQADDEEARMETKMWNRERNARVSYDTPTTGTLENTEWTTQLGRFDFKRQTFGIKLSGDYFIGDKLLLEPMLNYSGSTYEQPQKWHRFVQRSADFNFNTSSRITQWMPVSDDAFDASLFDYQKHEINTDELDEDIFSAGLNLGWNNRADDIGLGFGAGFKYQHKEKTYDYERTEYRFGDGLTLADIEWSRGCPDEMPSCDSDMFITMDSGSIDSLTEAFLDSADTDLRDNEDDDNNRDYNAVEEVTAGYLLIRHAGEKHLLIGGARYEDTNFDSTGRREDKNLGEFVPTSNKNNYENWLGSATLRYDLGEKLVLRAAFAQSISRPRLSRQAARGESQDFDGSEIVITRGNPNLRPREANNFDLGVEWYFGESAGLLSVAVFYKITDNEIFRTTRDAEILFDQDGNGTEELTSARIREYVNGDDAKLLGLEIGLTKELDEFIPGLGFNFNVTVLDSKFDVELEDGESRSPRTFIQQADFTANGVVYYQRGRFEARAAINHTGLKLNNLYAGNINDSYRDQYDKARTQVDAQLRYDVTNRFSLYANATNLLGAEQYELFGRAQELTRWESDFGRSFFVGASFRR